MRVTHVYKDYYPPVFGGIEQHLNTLCTGLAQAGVGVSVLVSSRRWRDEEVRNEGVRIVRARELARLASAPLNPTFPWLLREVAAASDLLHFHFPNPTGDVAYVLSRCRTPYVVTYHSDVVRQRYALWAYLPFARRFLARARAIIVASPNHVSMSTLLPSIDAPVRVIPYGVEEWWMEPPPPALVEAWRARFPGPVVLFVGQFRHYKGVDVLIRAMAGVEGSLVLVGDGPARPEYEVLSTHLGIGDRVKFLPRLPREDLRALYRNATVLALPSTNRAEAFGIVQVEAMAAGTPVVSTELGTGTTYVNRHGATGLTVPPNSVDELRAALTAIVTDRRYASTLGEQARALVEREFLAPRMVERTFEVYRYAFEAR